MTTLLIDVGDLYDRAKRAAKAAVLASPRSSYSLVDVQPDEESLFASLRSSFSTVLVHATLNGCYEALLERAITPDDLRAAPLVPPPGTSVKRRDLREAASWLADALTQRSSEDERQTVVDDAAEDGGWCGDPERVSAHMLALVVVAGAAADRG